MMYRYMTLQDGTEFVHSNLLDDGRVKVFFERPDEKLGFCDATCYLPDYTWESIVGFSQDEVDELETLLRNVAHIVFELAQEGGFDRASGF